MNDLNKNLNQLNLSKFDIKEFQQLDGLAKTNLSDVKQLLVVQIYNTMKINQTLQNRCCTMREMIDMFDTRVQFDDNLVLKEKDINKLTRFIKDLSTTLKETSQTEVELGMKQR